jgi:hypothetical protein
MARILIRKLEGKRSLGRPRYRWEHRNKSAPVQTAVIIFERTQINPQILVLLEKRAKKFCDVYRSGNCIALFTRAMRGFPGVFMPAGAGRVFLFFRKLPDWLWCLSSLLLRGYWEPFDRGLKRLRH